MTRNMNAGCASNHRLYNRLSLNTVQNVSGFWDSWGISNLINKNMTMTQTMPHPSQVMLGSAAYHSKIHL